MLENLRCRTQPTPAVSEAPTRPLKEVTLTPKEIASTRDWVKGRPLSEDSPKPPSIRVTRRIS